MEKNFATKLLSISVLTLLWCNISYAKISKDYYSLIFDGCMEEALKHNAGYKITKNYCTCSADHFNKNYDDESLAKLVRSEGGSVYNDIVNYVVSKCRREVGLE